MGVIDNNIIFLKEILERIERGKGSNFTGIGIILYKDISTIPYSPLRRTLPPDLRLPVENIGQIVDALISINQSDSQFHDGFHLMSDVKKLTHICCYFSPPIAGNGEIEYEFGGRYRAAYYGSYLSGVSGIGVIGSNYGPTIFSKGKKL